RRERRALPRPALPGDEHEPLLVARELQELRRDPELLDRRDLLADEADREVPAEPLLQHAAAVAAPLLVLEEELALEPRAELVPALLSGELEGDALGVLGAHGVALEVREHAVAPEERGAADREMEVRGVVVAGDA